MLSRQSKVTLFITLMAAGLLPMDALAQGSFLQEAELVHTLHLYSSTLSLPSSDEIKTASVCFVTDTSACGGDFGSTENSSENGANLPDYNLDDAERCKKEGYTLTSCANGGIPEGFCIYDSNFFKNCRCPTGYKTCEPPYYGVGQTCSGKYESCEEDIERACKELNPDYTNTCESGWQINPNDQCKYDETFGTCCNQCIGYDYTDIPEGYVQDGEACTDCDGQTKYKLKPNPCDGFLDCGSMGGAAGAETCLSGTITKYDNCKPCPNLGTLTSCPSGAVCSFEECSGKWYITGCDLNYEYYCAQPEKDCAILGYQRINCAGNALICPYNSAYKFCL